MNTTTEKKQDQSQLQEATANSNWQGVDKDPAEEKGKGEKVTPNDLKDKTVDRDTDDDDDERNTRINDIL